jgi:hypothetical protein
MSCRTSPTTKHVFKLFDSVLSDETPESFDLDFGEKMKLVKYKNERTYRIKTLVLASVSVAIFLVIFTIAIVFYSINSNMNPNYIWYIILISLILFFILVFSTYSCVRN